MKWRPPTAMHTRQVRGAPARPSGPSRIARIGAPSLVALSSAIVVLALLTCALLIPGFVLPASAETTSSTQVTPDSAGPDGSARAATSGTAPADSAPSNPATGRKLVTLAWGSGNGQVGLAQPVEGLTRGPEALAVSPDGRIAVLDSVNSRLVLLAPDGAAAGTIPLTLTEPRFLAVDGTTIYVLDADTDHQLVSFDWQGTPLRAAQVPAQDDVVTGLFITDDGPCVEIAHDQVFLVEFKDNSKPTVAGQAVKAAKPAVAALHGTAGRPVDRDLGKAVKLTFKPKDGVKIRRYKVDKKSLKGDQTQSAAPAFKAGKPIEQLVSVDGDGQGGLIIGARLRHTKADPAGAPSLIIGRLPAGATGDAPVLANTLTLSDSPFAYLGQPYVVAPDGRVYQPVGSEQGYAIMVYSLPGLTPVAAAPASATTQEVQP